METRTAMISGALRAWRSVVLDFEGPELTESEAAFRDFRLDVRFQHTDTGAAVVTPGFFAADGAAAETGAGEGNVWRVRFRPPTSGVWRWRARFRSGADIALLDGGAVDFAGASAGAIDGATGALKIGPPKMMAPDLRARGGASIIGGRLSFAQTGGAEAGRALLASYLLHGKEFDGASEAAIELSDPVLAPHLWREGDPIWGDRGRGAIGAVRAAAERGANILRLSPVLVDGAALVSGPWRGRRRDVFDVSRVEQWAMVLHAAERLGLAILLAPGGRTLDGAATPLDAIGLDRAEQRLLLREITARCGHLNGLIWEADASVLGAEASYLDEIDSSRSRCSPGDASAITLPEAASPDLALAAEAPIADERITQERIIEEPARRPRRDRSGGRASSAAQREQARPEASFEGIDDVDAYLGGPNSLRLGAMSERALEALLNAADVRQSMAQSDAVVDQSEGSDFVDEDGIADLGETPLEEDLSSHEAVATPQGETERDAPVAPEAEPENDAAQVEGGASEEDPTDTAPRDYVDERRDFDEIDEALQELRRGQKQGAAVPSIKASRTGGVRAARRTPHAASVKPEVGAHTSAAQDERPAEEEPQDRVPRAAVAGIGDSDITAESLSILSEESQAESRSASLLYDEKPRAADVSENSTVDTRSAAEPAQPARGPEASGEVGSAARRAAVATPDYQRRSRKAPPRPQEGAAAIALSLYVMRGGGAANAEPISLTEPLDLAEIAADGALVARFAGADAASAGFARLGLHGASTLAQKTERIEPFALFTELDALLAAAEESGSEYLEIAVQAARDASDPALKLWRIPLMRSVEEAPDPGPPPPTKDELAAQALEAEAHLVRIDLIDPEFDMVVASFGPAGFEAPIEAAGRVLNVKAVIGGRAVAALRARLFVPAAARCPRAEDRPMRIGAEATCHFYGCVFAGGRQEIELVAAKDSEALDRLIDAPDVENPGILLRARVRMALY